MEFLVPLDSWPGYVEGYVEHFWNLVSSSLGGLLVCFILVSSAERSLVSYLLRVRLSF